MTQDERRMFECNNGVGMEYIMRRYAYFTKRVIGKPAVAQNGQLDGKDYPISTRKQLADWLNDLARRIHIEATAGNSNGYLATADNIG